MNHKLQAPIPSQSAVIRKALLSQIQTAASTAGCIVIQAPAGHGKTTLLSQLLHASKDEGIATAWITLDESDNDIHRLLSHLDELLGSLEESTDVETFAENNDANGHSTWADLFLARLSAIGSRVHFYFDEFHTIDEADVEAFFSELTRKLPESATISSPLAKFRI